MSFVRFVHYKAIFLDRWPDSVYLSIKWAVFWTSVGFRVDLLHTFDGNGIFDGFGYEALEDFAGAELDEVAGAIGEHIAYTLSPSYGRCQLSQEVCLDGFRVSGRLCGNILINRADRRLDLGFG